MGEGIKLAVGTTVGVRADEGVGVGIEVGTCVGVT